MERDSDEEEDFRDFERRASEALEILNGLKENKVNVHDDVNEKGVSENVLAKKRLEQWEKERKNDEKKERENWWSGAGFLLGKNVARFRNERFGEAIAIESDAETRETCMDNKEKFVRLRNSNDYSPWEKWLPDDPVSKEEQARIEKDRERQELDMFEKENSSFCNEFKEDMKKREQEERRKVCKVDSLKSKAIKYIRSNQFASALILLKKALKLQPVRGDILANITLCFLKEKSYIKALEFAERSLFVDDMNIKASWRRATCLENSNRLSEAHEEILKASKIAANKGDELAPQIKMYCFSLEQKINDQVVFCTESESEIVKEVEKCILALDSSTKAISALTKYLCAHPKQVSALMRKHDKIKVVVQLLSEDLSQKSRISLLSLVKKLLLANDVASETMKENTKRFAATDLINSGVLGSLCNFGIAALRQPGVAKKYISLLLLLVSDNDFKVALLKEPSFEQILSTFIRDFTADDFFTEKVSILFSVSSPADCEKIISGISSYTWINSLLEHLRNLTKSKDMVLKSNKCADLLISLSRSKVVSQAFIANGPKGQRAVLSCFYEATERDKRTIALKLLIVISNLGSIGGVRFFENFYDPNFIRQLLLLGNSSEVEYKLNESVIFQVLAGFCKNPLMLTNFIGFLDNESLVLKIIIRSITNESTAESIGIVIKILAHCLSHDVFSDVGKQELTIVSTTFSQLFFRVVTEESEREQGLTNEVTLGNLIESYRLYCMKITKFNIEAISYDELIPKLIQIFKTTSNQSLRRNCGTFLAILAKRSETSLQKLRDHDGIKLLHTVA